VLVGARARLDRFFLLFKAGVGHVEGIERGLDELGLCALVAGGRGSADFFRVELSLTGPGAKNVAFKAHRRMLVDKGGRDVVVILAWAAVVDRISVQIIGVWCECWFTYTSLTPVNGVISLPNLSLAVWLGKMGLSAEVPKETWPDSFM